MVAPEPCWRRLAFLVSGGRRRLAWPPPSAQVRGYEGLWLLPRLRVVWLVWNAPLTAHKQLETEITPSLESREFGVLIERES